MADNDFVCFLNDDTFVGPDWLYNLQKCFEINKDCAIASPSTCYASGYNQCDWNIARRRFSMTEEDIINYSKNLEEGYSPQTIVGFCMLTKKSILKDIGGFDYKRYGIGNYEETDLQFRLYQLGYKSYWVKNSYVHHYGHSTFKKIDVDFNALVKRNNEIFIKRQKDKNLYVANDVEIDEVIYIGGF